MNRSHRTEAIVLRNHRIGDIHRGVVMLTPEGLVRAIAHGAHSPRGKLRGTTTMFCCGTAYLYSDRSRDSVKITDFDVRNYFSAIREDLVRYYTASLWAESVLRTYGGGRESALLYELLVQSLGELERRPPAQAELVSVHFVWRFLEYGGMQPDLHHCAVTGEFLSESQPVYYSSRDSGFCAPAHATELMPCWQPGAAAYLRYSGGLDLVDALRVLPPDGATGRIKRVLYSILEEQVESPLNVLRSGSGIL